MANQSSQSNAEQDLLKNQYYANVVQLLQAFDDSERNVLISACGLRRGPGEVSDKLEKTTMPGQERAWIAQRQDMIAFQTVIEQRFPDHIILVEIRKYKLMIQIHHVSCFIFSLTALNKKQKEEKVVAQTPSRSCKHTL